MIRERRQTLDLVPPWRVVKWDAAPEFVGSMESSFTNLSVAEPRSVKAADVVAVRSGRGRTPLLLVAEFKDFAHPDIPPAQLVAKAQQATSDEVMRDVVAKVIDSLCGATFAHDTTGERSDELEGFHVAVGKPSTRLLVLYCVELPKPVVAVLWNTELKRRLRWLGPSTRVIFSTGERAFIGNGITYSVSPRP